MTQMCTPDYGVYYVNAQSDLDTIAAECTTVNGSIVLGNNYTGSFSLPNVQNITHRIQADYRPYFPAPTSMDLSDLEFLGDSLSLSYLSTLANLSAPKLKTVGSDIWLGYVQTVNLRSLEEADQIYMCGNITR
ncbi:hypothetical protein PHISP_05690 [Aspergillus sp. HF37]|nr:hypothetical protein PHISP_05690 [Aspergillus sp. HF37]